MRHYLSKSVKIQPVFVNVVKGKLVKILNMLVIIEQKSTIVCEFLVTRPKILCSLFEKDMSPEDETSSRKKRY